MTAEEREVHAGMSMLRRDIVHMRCFNHAQREAAARCPQCGRHFCRECVSEHTGRFLCAACMVSLTPDRANAQPARARLRPFLQIVLGIGLLWTLFYAMGAGLLQVPAVFHDQADAGASYWEEP